MSIYLVLGAGLQGTAAAHDLILHGGAKRLLLADSEPLRLAAAKRRLEILTGFEALETVALDVASEDQAGLRELFEVADLVMNCLPYRFALGMTSLALDMGCHIADLGGNTQIVRQQLELAAGHARGQQVAVLPDCGLMPGMGNLFVAHAVRELGDCDSVKVRCGGLPVEPTGPLGYALLFNVYGLLNEYFGVAQVLRGGQVEELPTFTGLEPIEIDFEGRGMQHHDCEALITSGGLSTAPWTFAGRIGELDYKTVRYLGHFEKFRLLLDLGLLGEEPIELLRGGLAVPRDVLATCLAESLTMPDVEDLAFLRCSAVAGSRSLELEMFDMQSPSTGFTAMERTTAYSAGACLAGVLSGHTKIGAGPLELAVDTSWYLDALALRGVHVEVRAS